jgi:hypothetical protein
MGWGILITVLAVGIIVGGLLALRGTGRAGMPDADVLERAKRRAREAREHEDTEDR